MEPQSSNPAPATNWPGAFGIYKYSRQAVRRNIWPLVGVYVIVFVLSVVVSTVLDPQSSGRSTDSPSGFTFLAFLVNLVVSAVAGVAVTDLLLSGAKGEKLTFGQSFRKVQPLWLKMVAQYVLLYVILLVSFLALIIPFFIVLPRVMLAPYFLVDKQMGPIEALKASWAQTKGNVGKVWGIIGASIAMALLIFTIIGIPFAIYFLIMYSAAYVVLYQFVQGQPLVAAQPAATAASDIPAAPAPQE
jgi:hypothetical protein